MRALRLAREIVLCPSRVSLNKYGTDPFLTGLFPNPRHAYPVGAVRRAPAYQSPELGKTPISFSASGVWRARKSRYAPIWQFFTRLSPHNAQCNQCSKIVKTPNSGTTGLLFHRKRHVAETQIHL